MKKRDSSIRSSDYSVKEYINKTYRQQNNKRASVISNNDISVGKWSYGNQSNNNSKMIQDLSLTNFFAENINESYPDTKRKKTGHTSKRAKKKHVEVEEP
jgi:hypothetical protein